MIGAALLASILFFQATPAAATAPAVTNADPAGPPASGSISPIIVTGKAADPEKQVVCHNEPVLGSLFPKRVCASKQALAERTRRDQEQVREWTALKPYAAH